MTSLEKHYTQGLHVAKRWTKEEDELILKLRDEGFTYREIAARLAGRSEAATKNRLAAIAPTNLRRRWTEEEIKLAFSLRESGHSNKYIARQLDRTPSAVNGFFNKYSTAYYTSAITNLEK